MGKDNDRHRRERERIAAILRRADLLGARRDPEIDRYLWMLEQGFLGPRDVDWIEMMLDDFEAGIQVLPFHLLEPPPVYNPDYPPDYVIGKLMETGDPYGPRGVGECGTTVVSGIPGGGKTSLLLNWIPLLRAHMPKVAILIFDVKGEFSCLASLPNAQVHKGRDLRLNPLRPPRGVGLDEWQSTPATQIIEYLGLKISRSLLTAASSRLCQEFGVADDPERPWPSLVNVLEYVRSRKVGFGKREYAQSLETALHGLLDDALGVFDTSDGLDPDRHLAAGGQLFVIQLETMPTQVQQIIISNVVSNLIASRRARNVHNQRMSVCVVIDEAQLVVSKKADLESRDGIAPFAHQFLNAREFGIGFVAVAHLLDHISTAVLAAARRMYVVGGLADRNNVRAAADAMNLPRGAEAILPKLTTGRALVREMGREGTEARACLVDLNAPEIAKDAVDEANRRRLMAAKLAQLPASPSKSLRGPSDSPPARETAKTPPTSAAATEPQPAGQDRLGPELMEILGDAARHWDDHMKERRERLGVKDYKLFANQCELLEGRKLLITHPERLGRTGYTFLEVTDAGWQLLDRQRAAHYIGHGSFVHGLLTRRCAKTLKARGYQGVKLEHQVGAERHAVDIFARDPDGVTHGFEITLGTSNVCSNATKSVAVPNGVDRVIFLCRLASDCREVEKKLRKDASLAPHMDRIRVERIDQYMS